jgi:hypothetical protein
MISTTKTTGLMLGMLAIGAFLAISVLTAADPIPTW